MAKAVKVLCGQGKNVVRGHPSFWIYFCVCTYLHAWVCICNCPGPLKIKEITPITLRVAPGLKKWEARTPARKPASALSVKDQGWTKTQLQRFLSPFEGRVAGGLEGTKNWTRWIWLRWYRWTYQQQQQVRRLQSQEPKLWQWENHLKLEQSLQMVVIEEKIDKRRRGIGKFFFNWTTIHFYLLLFLDLLDLVC